LEEMRDFHSAAQRQGEDFVRSVQHLQPLERAEAWLRHVADRERSGYDVYSTQEAIVYLVSRGYDCGDIKKDLVATWKRDERHAIEVCMQEEWVWDMDTGEKVELYRKGLTFDEASDILNVSPHRLMDFWRCSHSQELSMPATMLRTADWCEVGGFDDWWVRFARLEYEAVIQAGVDPVPASLYLFAMCRSDYAIELTAKALRRILEAIELPDYGQTWPWRRWRLTARPKATVQLSYAASIVFANERLKPLAGNQELVDRASESLLKHQSSTGHWTRCASDEEPSIETTAMAIHALAVRQPRGWELAASRARDWLWSVQDSSGCWIEYSCPDSVYLTVLVLDALELAAGRGNVTFSLELPPVEREDESDSIGPVVIKRIEEMHRETIEVLYGLKRGQAAIYQRIGSESRAALELVLEQIQQGRVDRGQLQSAVDSIRRAVKRIQEVGLPVDDKEMEKVLEDVHRAIESNLALRQRLELSVPVIPLLLEYKVELGAGVDLDIEAVWANLIQLVQRPRGT
jgi:hypothetical protein